MNCRCSNYVGMTCVDGSCPIALCNDEQLFLPFLNCDDCPYYKGCEDCIFSSDCGKCTMQRYM